MEEEEVTMRVERSNARACEQRREQRWVCVMEASGDCGEVGSG
jgi:hypothetical protein